MHITSSLYTYMERFALYLKACNTRYYMGADGDRVCQASLCDLWKSTATVRSLDEVAQLNRFADPKREDTLEVDILLVLFLLNYNDHTFIHIHSICIYHIYIHLFVTCKNMSIQKVNGFCCHFTLENKPNDPRATKIPRFGVFPGCSNKLET